MATACGQPSGTSKVEDRGHGEKDGEQKRHQAGCDVSIDRLKCPAQQPDTDERRYSIGCKPFFSAQQVLSEWMKAKEGIEERGCDPSQYAEGRCRQS